MLFSASDNSANIIRVMFVDFAKAFDLIDHNVLMRKLIEYDFPPHVTAWSLSFLQGREQFVKINNCLSSVAILNSGCPQGTLSGPNNFKVLINDLRFSLSYIKYVDDTSVVSVSDDFNDNSLQVALIDLADWCKINSMRINAVKTKEMAVCFGKRFDVSALPSLSIDGSTIQRVDCFKLLGVYFNSDLTWQHHVDYILKKVSKRIYFMYLLMKAGVNSSDAVSVYCSLIRTVLEYASPVWHAGLTKTQSDRIEGIQKRCLKIVFPDLSYNEALFVSGLGKLSVRREKQARDLFIDIKQPGNVLNYLLTPYKIDCEKKGILRESYPYVLPRSNTLRMNRSFVAYCISRRF